MIRTLARYEFKYRLISAFEFHFAGVVKVNGLKAFQIYLMKK